MKNVFSNSAIANTEEIKGGFFFLKSLFGGWGGYNYGGSYNYGGCNTGCYSGSSYSGCNWGKW